MCSKGIYMSSTRVIYAEQESPSPPKKARPGQTIEPMVVIKAQRIRMMHKTRRTIPNDLLVPQFSRLACALSFWFGNRYKKTSPNRLIAETMA